MGSCNLKPDYKHEGFVSPDATDKNHAASFDLDNSILQYSPICRTKDIDFAKDSFYAETI